MTSFVPDSSLLYCSSSRVTSLVLWFESFDASPFRRCVISSTVGIFRFNFSRLKIHILVTATKMSLQNVTQMSVMNIYLLVSVLCFALIAMAKAELGSVDFVFF